MTGGVFILPAPKNEDRPDHYACTLLTAADLHGAVVHPLLRPGPAAFRVVLLYMRGKSMAFRSCSSDTNAWGPEGEISRANFRSRQLGEMDAGVAVARRHGVLAVRK
ncbi:hypothetical protein BAE44_0012332 [Dichanthelium oligosanthes]|uniref:Uncharacterized protein n=1 Tax=Dichanthelium oligosanthes TaxID=888268 RepID=A0A1E5VNE0_9POAL|nr:hypothetical protein BAE44_0012332 [Dichanthelium oligosanthes]